MRPRGVGDEGQRPPVLASLHVGTHQGEFGVGRVLQLRRAIEGLLRRQRVARSEK